MKTNNPWLHRYAIFVAFSALIAIAAGAVVTSLERPIAATPAASINPTFETWHHMLGGVACILTIGLAIWLARSKSDKPVIQVGWFALVAGLIEGGMGAKAVLHALAPLTGILHALLAQVFFGSIAALALMTSAAWSKSPELIEDSWRPSMRSLALAIPSAVLLQTTLGASYRYHALGVLWHILNAMIVLLLILAVAVFLIRQFPEHPTLRPAAVALAVITSIQVVLGFTTLMMLILFPETSLAVLITSVLHVTTGALTFGTAGILAILMRHNIRAAGHTPVTDTE
jgi:heme A synthase